MVYSDDTIILTKSLLIGKYNQPVTLYFENIFVIIKLTQSDSEKDINISFYYYDIVNQSLLDYNYTRAVSPCVKSEGSSKGFPENP